MLRRLFGPALGAFATLATVAGQALAEPVPSLNLRGFEPPTHPAGLAYLEPTETPGAGEWNLGTWFSYAYRPVVVETEGSSTVPVRHQLSLDLVGSIGLGQRLGIGVSLPAVVYQNGDVPPPSVAPGEPPAFALGSVVVVPRATLVPQGSFGGFGLAALGRVELPTGSKTSYLGEGQVRGELRLLGELGVLGSSIRASLGARMRSEERVFAGETFGHDLPWGLGVLLRPQALGIDSEGRWLWALEGHGAVALTPHFGAGEQSPAALSLAARRTFGDAFAVLGLELPLDGAMGVPLVRGVLSVGFAPRFPDEDGDGIPDDKDGCVGLAEDRDGFEDGDGCPDFDNDNDGVPDGDDRCPRELEDADGFEDDDGCPDPDNDGDGIPDVRDACPNAAGAAAPDPKRNGCPERDRDMDGIPDPRDRCPLRAEDRDGFEDDDGCPDVDDDRDGVPDRTDACPRVAGPPRSDPTLNGCPSPDHDGDTFDDADDRCPDAAEVFDGFEDDDGCPEPPAAGAPRPLLAELAPARNPKGVRFLLKLTRPIAFEGPSVDAALTAGSQGVLRAIASISNAHPDMVLMVALRPNGRSPEAEQLALTRSFAVVDALRSLTHRDDAAETIGWKAVERVPGAALKSGIGFLVLVPLDRPSSPPATPPADQSVIVR